MFIRRADARRLGPRFREDDKLGVGAAVYQTADIIHISVPPDARMKQRANSLFESPGALVAKSLRGSANTFSPRWDLRRLPGVVMCRGFSRGGRNAIRI